MIKLALFSVVVGIVIISMIGVIFGFDKIFQKNNWKVWLLIIMGIFVFVGLKTRMLFHVF